MTPEGEVRRYQSGALPFSVDAYVDTYHGPAWVKRRLRGRSGWLQVSRARLTTEISDWSATIVAGITDDGERLGKVAANSFMAMCTSGPESCFHDPPEELADLTEMLFWDFLGRCDLRHLDMLAAADVEREQRLAAEQARGETVLHEAERYIAELQRRRRSPEISLSERERLAERIGVMEARHEAASGWLVRHLAQMREEGETFEAAIMAALENHGEYEELYAVHWVARSQYDRVLDRGLLRELTTTGSLVGVPRQARLTDQEIWEIEEAQQRLKGQSRRGPTRTRIEAPAPHSVEPETEWRREERELLAALEEWQAKKVALDVEAIDDNEAPEVADFPPEALATTTAGEAPSDPPADSSDVGALIEGGLAKLLKDLRPQ